MLCFLLSQESGTRLILCLKWNYLSSFWASVLWHLILLLLMIFLMLHLLIVSFNVVHNTYRKYSHSTSDSILEDYPLTIDFSTSPYSAFALASQVFGVSESGYVYCSSKVFGYMMLVPPSFLHLLLTSSLNSFKNGFPYINKPYRHLFVIMHVYVGFKKD